MEGSGEADKLNVGRSIVHTQSAAVVANQSSPHEKDFLRPVTIDQEAYSQLYDRMLCSRIK